MVHAMREITIRVFEHLEITSPLDVDKRMNYMQSLLRGSTLKKYKTILTECKENTKGISGYQWKINEVKDVTMERFWT